MLSFRAASDDQAVHRYEVRDLVPSTHSLFPEFPERVSCTRARRAVARRLLRPVIEFVQGIDSETDGPSVADAGSYE